MKISGVVVEGKKLGRKLGFPTANILISEALNIENGVYLTDVIISASTHKAITNIGNNPTIGRVSRRVESYIFDFEGDLYGQTIEVIPLQKMRNELKFSDVDSLKTQVLKDIEQAKKLLK